MAKEQDTPDDARPASQGNQRPVRRDVFTQFLVESLTVTLWGMAAGLLVGWGICIVLPRFTKMPVAISWEPVALAAAAAVLVGTFFGIQPARRAARLSPVEALR